jgi:hypothetical protein
MPWLRRGPREVVDSSALVLAMRLSAKAARQAAKRNLEHEFRLRVTRPDGQPLDIELRCTVPWDRVPAVGREVPVKVSRSDPGYVSIDFDRVPSVNAIGLAAARAAHRGKPFDVAQALGYQRVDRPRHRRNDDAP